MNFDCINAFNTLKKMNFALRSGPKLVPFNSIKFIIFDLDNIQLSQNLNLILHSIINLSLKMNFCQIK